MTTKGSCSPDIVDFALEIIAKAPGARVFPICAGAKFPPLINAWPTEASADPMKIRAWWAQWPRANIGVTGLVVLDIDVRDQKPGIASFQGLGLSSEEVASTLIVSTPSGGKHVYFKQPDGEIVSSRNGFRPGLDLKADRGYVVGPGSRLDGCQQPYEISQHMLPALCPEALLMHIRAGASRQKRPDRQRPGIGAAVPKRSTRLILARGAVIDDPDMIERAVAWLSDEAPPAIQGQNGDNTTFRVACELGDLGLSESTAFALMLEHYNPRCAPSWESNDLQTKVSSAWQSGQNQIGAKHPEAVRVATREDFAGIDIPSLQLGARSPLEGRLMRQGDPLRHRPYLLKHLLPRTGTALFVSSSGAGKTAVVGQLAKSLGTGTQFFGTAVKEKCGTLILAAEGLGGLQARLNVLALAGGLPIYALPLDTLSGEAAFTAMLSDVKKVAALCLSEHGVRLGLVIVDTLAASGLIANENDNSECAAAIKKLQRLAIDAECLVMATHHSPKIGTDPRGGSALAAGVDLILTITRNGQAQVRVIQCTKGRDSREGKLGSFTLVPESVGIDEDGDAITACTVSMSDSSSISEAAPVCVLPTPAQIAEISERIDEGAPDGLQWRFAYSSHDDGDHWAGVPIGEVMGFVAQGSEGKVLAQTILNNMIAENHLAKGDRKDPAAPKNAQRKPVPFVKLP